MAAPTSKDSGMFQPPRRLCPRAGVLVAASFASLMFPATFAGAEGTSGASAVQEYATVIGESRRVLLGTGALANLNTASLLRTAPAAEAEVLRGEVLFEVGGGDPAPLRIAAGSITVQADASAFLVRVHDATHVDVLVREGAVQLEAGAAPVRVSSRQMARVTPSGVALQQLSDSEVARRLLWTTGYVSFTGETLTEAIAEFNRYNNERKLVIGDPSIGGLSIGGKFGCKDLDGFLAALGPIGVESLDGGMSASGARLIRLVATKRARR